MRIRVLGCSGSKMPGRLLTSFLVNDRILLDAGSAAQVLNIHEQAEITDIFVSHPHLDHIADIAFISDNLLHYYFEKKRPPIKVHALETAVQSIRTHLINGTIWPDFTVLPHPKSPVLEFSPLINGQTYDADGISLTPFEVNHSGEGATGYMIRHNGKTAVYTGDTGPDKWPESLLEIGVEFKDLIAEVSFPNEMKSLALLTGHMTPELLHNALEKLPKIPNIHITHIKSLGARRVENELRELFPAESLRILREGDILDL